MPLRTLINGRELVTCYWICKTVSDFTKYVYERVCENMCMHTCLCVRTCVYTQDCVYVCVCVCGWLCDTCLCVACVDVSMCLCSHLCVCGQACRESGRVRGAFSWRTVSTSPLNLDLDPHRCRSLHPWVSCVCAFLQKMAGRLDVAARRSLALVSETGPGEGGSWGRREEFRKFSALRQSICCHS